MQQAHDLGRHRERPRPRCPACKLLIDAKRFGSCAVERHKLVHRGTLDLVSGEMKEGLGEWRTEPCNIPLFHGTPERARGICRSCGEGWTHPHNYATDNGKATISAALAASNDTNTRGIKP